MMEEKVLNLSISLVVYGILDKVFEVYLTIFLFTTSL